MDQGRIAPSPVYSKRVCCNLNCPGGFLDKRRFTRINLRKQPTFHNQWRIQGKTQVFWHQSDARTAATVRNWSGKTLSPGALLAVLYFSSYLIFPPV